MKKPKFTRSGVTFLTRSAIIAASYTALTLIFSFSASGAIQVRFSEALCILPFFTPSAIPGLTVGCLISNILTGGAPWDIVFGTAATCIGAILSYLVSYAPKKFRYATCIPPIALNTLIIPQILKRVYGMKEALAFLTLTVGLGETVSVGVLGGILFTFLYRNKSKLFV